MSPRDRADARDHGAPRAPAGRRDQQKRRGPPLLSRAERELLGRHIFAMRTRAGLTQTDLGDGIYGRSAVSRIESGMNVPSFDALVTFAGALGVPVAEMFPEEF